MKFIQHSFVMLFLFFIFIAFPGPASFAQDDPLEKDIIEDSEIGYTYRCGGIVVGGPRAITFTAVCKNGKVQRIYTGAYWDGKTKDDVKRWKGSKKKYLKLWKEVLTYDPWQFKDWDDVLKEAKGEDPYENLSTSRSWHVFKFRIKDREHRVETYHMVALKDKRYLKTIKVINRFFGLPKDENTD